MILFAILLFVQVDEFYYKDGTEIQLVNGLIIRTFEKVSDTPTNLSWREDGEYIVISKAHVQSTRTFSMRLRGRAPHKEYKKSSQRRVTGSAIAYKKAGDTYLRVTHLNARGRNISGMLTKNIVKEVKVESTHATKGTTLRILMQRFTPKHHLELRFYDTKGKKLQTCYSDLDKVPQSRQQKKARTLQFELTLQANIDPNRLGLLEAVSTSKNKPSAKGKKQP